MCLLMWVIPMMNPMFMTSYPLLWDIPLCLLLASIISTSIQTYIGKEFLKGAIHSLKTGTANMDVLIIMSTTVAWAYAMVLLILPVPDNIRSNHELYMDYVNEQINFFDTSTFLLTIIILGKYM